MALMDEATRRLQSLLVKEACVDEKLAEHVITSLQLASIADLAQFWPADGYLTGIDADVLDSTQWKGSRIQAARLRTAVDLGRAEVQQAMAAGKRSAGLLEDWDAPLDPNIRVEAEASFKQKYHLQFCDAAKPAPALFARLFREFKRGCLSVHEINRVKSVADSPADMHSPAKRRHLGDGLELVLGDEADSVASPFGSIHEFLWRLQILAHGWAVAGQNTKPSKLTSGVVADAELQQCLSYVHFVQVQVLKHGGPMQQCLNWVVDRDRQTRAAARQLAQEGYPFGEALLVAREQKVAILWTCAQLTPAGQAAPVQGRQGLPPDAAAKGSARAPLQGGQQTDRIKQVKQKGDPNLRIADCCAKFNAGGCERKQKLCPDKKKHACSNKLDNGLLCGSWQHHKGKCPYH